jgi:hypothetical protein
MTFLSPFMARSPFFVAAQSLQLHRYAELSVGPHGCNEKFHTAATLRSFAEGAINFTWGYYDFIVGGAHPLNRGVDAFVIYGLATTDDHG